MSPRLRCAGIRARTTKDAKPSILSQKNWERQHPGSVEQVLRRFGIASSQGVVRRRPGRGGRPNAYYALWAEAYVRLVAAGSRRPIVELAADPVVPLEGRLSSADDASVASVRDIIATARDRGLLTDAPPGRPGGSLTPKARRLLRQISEGVTHLLRGADSVPLVRHGIGPQVPLVSVARKAPKAGQCSGRLTVPTGELAGVAQSAEHRHGKAGVVGSIPTSSSIRSRSDRNPGVAHRPATLSADTAG
jgi:hypothetical protein